MKDLIKALAVIALALPVSGWGAEPYTETFSDGSSAGQGSVTMYTGGWAYTGSAARIKFEDTASSFAALPDTGVLRPTASAFTGNYAQAGIGVIGFRFRAGSPAPSHVYIELAGGSSLFQRIFPVPVTGEWVTLMTSVDSFAAGGWVAKRGSSEDFPAALADVKSVEIKIHRAGAVYSEHAVDDIFVDGLPQAASAGSDWSMAWDALQLGAAYTMQESASLNGPWKDAGTATATNRLQHFPIPKAGDALHHFYRLRGP